MFDCKGNIFIQYFDMHLRKKETILILKCLFTDTWSASLWLLNILATQTRGLIRVKKLKAIFDNENGKIKLYNYTS